MEQHSSTSTDPTLMLDDELDIWLAARYAGIASCFLTWHPTQDETQAWDCMSRFMGEGWHLTITAEVLQDIPAPTFRVQAWRDVDDFPGRLPAVSSTRLSRALCEVIAAAHYSALQDAAGTGQTPASLSRPSFLHRIFHRYMLQAILGGCTTATGAYVILAKAMGADPRVALGVAVGIFCLFVLATHEGDTYLESQEPTQSSGLER